MNENERDKLIRLIQKMDKSPEFENVRFLGNKETRSILSEAYDPHKVLFKYRFADRLFYLYYDKLTSQVSIVVYPDELDFMVKLPKHNQFTLKAVKEASKESIRNRLKRKRKRYNV